MPFPVSGKRNEVLVFSNQPHNQRTFKCSMTCCQSLECDVPMWVHVALMMQEWQSDQ